MKIILASQSPRRKELLTQIGFSYEVQPSEKEEIITQKDPVEVVKELANQKAEDVAQSRNSRNCEELVIGADTVVVAHGQILGKPRDLEHAKEMIRMLQGDTHSVYTGVSLIFPDEVRTFAVESKVKVYPMTEKEIEEYIEMEKPLDAAGSYRIQGLFARFIQDVQGDYTNIVGLPVARVYQEIKSKNNRNILENIV